MARADAGLTISELAKRAGVSRDTISNAERGQHSLQATTLHKVAQALGRAPSELLAEEERLAPKAQSSSLEPTLDDVLDGEQRIALMKSLEDEIRHFTARWHEELQDAEAQDRYWHAGIQVAATGYTDIISRRDLLRKVHGIGKLSKQEQGQKFIENRLDPEFQAAMDLMDAWACMMKAADGVEEIADTLWGAWAVREEAEERRKTFSVIQGDLSA